MSGAGGAVPVGGVVVAGVGGDGALDGAGDLFECGREGSLVVEVELVTIPIYRRSVKEHLEAREIEKSKCISDRHQNLQGCTEDYLEKAAQSAAYQFDEQFTPWPFNEVVAFVRLYVIFRSQIRGDIFVWKHKRYGESARRIYRIYQTAAIEIDENDFKSVDEIPSLVLARINEIVKELPIPQNYAPFVDGRAFENVAKFIDWIELLEIKQQPPAPP